MKDEDDSLIDAIYSDKKVSIRQEAGTNSVEHILERKLKRKQQTDGAPAKCAVVAKESEDLQKRQPTF